MSHGGPNAVGSRTPSEFAHQALSEIHDMIGYWDLRERCCYANSAFRLWFGKSPEDMLGLTLEDLLGPLYATTSPQIQDALRGIPQQFEIQLPRPDGTPSYCIASFYPDLSQDRGDTPVQGFTAHIVDVTRLKLLEMDLRRTCAEAEHHATHDFLTGLPNRVQLNQRILAAIQSAEAHETIIGVALIDLDEFKLLNDTYGHAVGDFVLQEIAKRMTKSIRTSDSITRIGGDEFLLLATDLVTVDSLHWILNHLRKVLCKPIECNEITLTPSLSCGVATFPHHGTTPAELMRNADQALYDAKKRGRSRLAFSRANRSDEPTAGNAHG